MTMRKFGQCGVWALLTASLLCGAATALAQDTDPPTRVARMSFADGSVSLQPAGAQDWVAAPLNRPLTTGDVLWADNGSRAELQLDGSVARLGNASELSLTDLSDDVTQLQLGSGTLIVRIRRLNDNETYEVDTPNLAFTALRPGTYRITVDPSGNSTAIAVQGGQGEVTDGTTAYTMQDGDFDVYSGANPLAVQAQQQPDPDAFDAWSADRDARWDRSPSARYVSDDIVGYEDLDDQGSWSQTPDYGPVWYPNGVPPGWAPYQTGYWAYIAPWGYTWVDAQPWGFAPFHYGRWIWSGRSWGWIPSPPRPERGPYIRPVYAPALVAWVGGVGTGAAVAWFALGPREVYVPSYPVSAGYVRNINVSNTTVNTTVINNVYNTTIINNRTVNLTYVNRGAPGAITATNANAFSSAQPIASNRVTVDPHALSTAPIRAATPAIVPARQAVLGPLRNVAIRPPAAVLSRAVVARTAPPAPAPTLEARLTAIKANGGKPLSVTQVRQIQQSAPVVRPAPIRVASHLSAPVKVPASPPRNNARPPQAALPVGRAPAPPAAFKTVPPAPAPAAVHARELPKAPAPPSPSGANSALEREHLQQQQQMRAQQEQEQQRVQQQQELDHQRLAKEQADAARTQELEQQHQQQTQELQQKHIAEQQALQAKQESEQRAAQPPEQHRAAPPAPPPPPAAHKPPEPPKP